MRLFSIVLASLLFCKAALSQESYKPIKKSDIPLDSSTGKISYQIIDTVPNTSKDILFSKALEWIATNFKDANTVIKLQDKEAGKIIVKGLSEEKTVTRVFGKNIDAPYYQNFSLNFSVKDNRYRVIITDFVGETPSQIINGRSFPSNEFKVEDHILYIPDQVPAKPSKVEITAYQVLDNVKQLAVRDFESIKSFMRQSASTGKKDDW